MTTGRRRLVLDRTFDQAIDTVLSAFLGEGFAIKLIEGGDLPERVSGRLRYARLVATLPELRFVPTRPSEGVPALLAVSLMRTLEDKVLLARETLLFAAELRRRKDQSRPT